MYDRLRDWNLDLGVNRSIQKKDDYCVAMTGRSS